MDGTGTQSSTAQKYPGSASAGVIIGVVSSTDSGSYIVEVDPISAGARTEKVQGHVVTSALAPFFGFKDAAMPSVGSTVACLSIPQEPFRVLVLGVITLPDGVSGAALKTNPGTGDPLTDSQNNQRYEDSVLKQAFVNNNRPVDVVSGDHVQMNEFGVLLRLFQHFAQLKASDLAQVQCFLFDDLVRIVSHNFQHFTALGESKVTHDGKAIYLEQTGSHWPSEGLGRVATIAEDAAAQEPVFQEEEGDSKVTADETKDLYKYAKEEEAHRLRAVERFKLYLGALGDFFNGIITRPEELNKHLNDQVRPEYFDKGLLQIKVGEDGSFQLRSVKEVILEKTEWILSLIHI